MLDIFFIRDVFESLKCCFDLWLSSMFDCIHVYVFLFFEKMFLNNLDSFSNLLTARLSIEPFELPFSIAVITISIHQDS